MDRKDAQITRQAQFSRGDGSDDGFTNAGFTEAGEYARKFAKPATNTDCRNSFGERGRDLGDIEILIKAFRRRKFM